MSEYFISTEERTAFTRWLEEHRGVTPVTSELYARLIVREAEGKSIALTVYPQLNAARQALLEFRGGGKEEKAKVWLHDGERASFELWCLRGGLSQVATWNYVRALESNRINSAIHTLASEALAKFRTPPISRAVLHAAFFLAMDWSEIAGTHDKRETTMVAFSKRSWPEAIADLYWTNVTPFDRISNAPWSTVNAKRGVTKPYHDAGGAFWGIWLKRLFLWGFPNTDSVTPEQIRLTPLLARAPGSLEALTQRELAAMFRAEMARSPFRRNENFAEWQMLQADEMRYVDIVSRAIYDLRVKQAQSGFEIHRDPAMFRAAEGRAQKELETHLNYSVWDGAPAERTT